MAMKFQGYMDEGEAIGLNEDEVHRLLAAERRRLAVEVLADRGPMDLECLAEAIVDREAGDVRDERTLQRAKIDLYHCHLPLMADLGAIEFDRRSKRVEDCRLGAGVA